MDSREALPELRASSSVALASMESVRVPVLLLPEEPLVTTVICEAQSARCICFEPKGHGGAHRCLASCGGAWMCAENCANGDHSEHDQFRVVSLPIGVPVEWPRKIATESSDG